MKVNEEFDTQYGYYNDTKKDKIYFEKKYKEKGWKYVLVKRIKTDTKGLKMYEITGMTFET